MKRLSLRSIVANVSSLVLVMVFIMSAGSQVAAQEKKWPETLTFKTDGIGWGLLMVNAAVEADFNAHWSGQVAGYWSDWNYFTSRVKFRTLSFFPEVRWWPAGCGRGWFGSAHLGLSWYNHAIGGKYRTQDRGGDDPAAGGGFGMGLRLPLGSGGHWGLELSAGAGVYYVHFDKFHNHHNGLLVRSDRSVRLLVDRLSLSFTYSIDATRGRSKKGGSL